MKKYLNNLLIGTALLIAAVSSLRADVVQVQFVGTPTGVNDGPDYVLPYAITVDGSAFPAICYDIFDNVVDGQTWSADELTLDQVATSDFFGTSSDTFEKYEEVAWLSLQSYTSVEGQIDLQHNIWNVFGGSPYQVLQGPGSYSAGLAATEANGFAGVDFSNVAFLIPVGSVAGSAPGQAFIIDPPGAKNGTAVPAPEPGSIVILGSALAMIALGWRRRLVSSPGRLSR
jgi:hypothetical protein